MTSRREWFEEKHKSCTVGGDAFDEEWGEEHTDTLRISPSRRCLRSGIRIRGSGKLRRGTQERLPLDPDDLEQHAVHFHSSPT